MAEVKLQSSDEEEFTVARKVAEMSVTIKNMLEGYISFSIFIEAIRHG
jgi:hypothetical protein